MNHWQERVRDLLFRHAGVVVIEAGRDWGPHRVLSAYVDPERPTIMLDLGPVDCDDEVLVGNSLSESIRFGLGAPLFGLGAPLDYGLAVFRAALVLLEPMVVVVMGAHRSESLVRQLARIVGEPNSLILQSPSPLSTWLDDVHCTRICPTDLAVTRTEAIDLFSAISSGSEIAEALGRSGGAIVVLERLLGFEDRGMEANPTAPTLTEDQGTARGSLVDVLTAQGRYVEALEVACRAAPHRASEIVRLAGNAAFDRGEFGRFWAAINALPKWTHRDDGVAYWWFSAAISVNAWTAFVPEVDELLARRTAPELRALRAVVSPGKESMEQAREAYAALPNATTSSGLAFVLLIEGRVAEAETMYHIAMDFAERQSVPRIVVSSAMNLALASISKGDYEAAKYWSGWSLRRFHALGLREELLRIALVNMDAFASLLIGSVQSAKQSLLGVTIDESVLGIPTLEGIVSTLGDLELVDGNPEKAIDFYSLNRASESRGSVVLAANDMVRALVAAGEDERAVFVAEEAMAMAVGLPDYHVSIARLALGCAHSADRSPLAEPLLRESIARFKKRPFSTHFAQASIHLARLYLEWSRPHDAQVVLSAARSVLLQLGDSGWRLLAGSEGQVAHLKAWVVGGRLPVHIRVLNARVVTTKNQSVHLSPRFAELLTILAAHPEGIRGEALALALYGERANQSTLKATVSRARKIVPIDSGPYRIAEPFRADFAEVLVLLQNGRVQAALELYRGPLLPESRAPMVVELRGYIEESLRQAVLASDDPDALIDFANQQGEDLQLWEEALRQLPPNDPRRPLVNARIRRIRKGW